MDGNSYYQNLLQQGFTPTDAAHYTKQYYPDFQAPMQGMGMMAPPPGSMEFTGAASTGLGTTGAGGAMAGANLGTAGAVTGGGMAAAGAGAAAAGGGMSFATIAVVSVLVLGGAGTAGYFIYDYLTEPDFYGEVYWTEYGSGLSFGEDELSMVFAVEEDLCSNYEDMFGDDTDAEFRNGFCFVSPDYDSYEVTDEGDYYNVCVAAEDIEQENECIKVYTLDRGIVIKEGDACDVMVGDISTPDWTDLDDEDSYDEFLDWQETWRDIASELEDEGPSSCDYSIDGGDDDTSSGGNIDTYQFSERDAAGAMSNASGDDLVHIKMVQGDDLNWALLKVSIVVDGGVSMNCQEVSRADENAECTYTTNDDMSWSVSQEITISEGAYDLCDGSNGGCDIDVTLTKIGVGSEEDKILREVSAYADATQ